MRPADSHRLKQIFAVLGLLLLAGCATSRPSVPPPSPSAPAAPQALSWTASIGALHLFKGEQTCTATLVRQDVILTAAHCLSDGQHFIPPQQFIFVPNEGAEPTLPGFPVVAVLAIGNQAQQGVISQAKVVDDWALLRIEPAPSELHPVAVNSLRWAEIEARLAAGDHFFSGGYGNPGLLKFTQHSNCQPIDAATVGLFLADGLIASDCIIRQRDSGGPMILVDIVGRPHLFAIISGIGRPYAEHPLGIGVISGSFINYLNGLNISDSVFGEPPAPAS